MPFQPQPTLIGKHIHLRPLTEQDYESLLAAASDPLIWEQHPAQRYKPEIFSAFFADSLQSGGALIALDASTGEVIGTSRYNGYDEAKSEIEIGWSFLKREYWGGSHNREMKQLMLNHAFQFLENVFFEVDSKNLRSQKAVEKIGGKRIESRLRDDGRTSVIFRITRSGYIL
ncbi:MAG: GNAT family N-acetyltransferase [Candidatus Kapaibacteriota bacterium]|jgi:RimJ/RimL family protein N-acetyltransferase